MFSLQKQFRVWWLQALYIIVLTGFVTLLYLNFVKSAVPFISKLFNPLRSNILLDVHSNEPMTWIARDVFLNIGRFSIFIIFALLLQFTTIQWALLVVAGFFVTV